MTKQDNPPIAKFKNAFSKSGTRLHFNNAGVAPLSRPAYEAVQKWSQRFFDFDPACIFDIMDDVEKTRHDLSAFLGAKANELAFFQSAASAISQVAFGLDLKPGDEVIVWDQEYPSNFHPWREAALRAGAKLIIAKSAEDLSTPLSAIEEVLSPRTRVIAFSWVQYRTGAIMDLVPLTALAKSRGIFTCADIIQGAGQLPFDFHASGLDAACGASHKWMVSPLSAGYLLLKEEHLERIQPAFVGAMTYGTPDDPATIDVKARTDAQRFEPGSKGVIEIAALGESVRLIRDVGVAAIAQEIEWLSRRLMHGLRERGYVINTPHGRHHRGSIVNFSPGSDSPLRTQSEIEKRLNELNVVFGKRPPGVRLAPHAYNTEEEINLILEALER